MRRPSLWLILVVILLGAFILREPRLRQVDDLFLSWFVEHTDTRLPPAHVTLVEIKRQDFRSFPVVSPGGGEAARTARKTQLRRTASPLEYALFLQAAMALQPAVIALEPVVIWRDLEKNQEQVFIDQAMRVPKLLVGMELGEKTPRDIPVDEIQPFTDVSGRRGGLAEYPGVSHRPDDDIRLISTPGFTNLPGDRSDRIRVPMLLEYRGEIVPSFPLQAILLWLRATPSDVKVHLGSEILLPNGWKIPLHGDGTTTINPAADGSVRHLSLNQLLLAAQEHEAHRPPTVDLSGIQNEILLLRIADDPLQPPNVFARAIATIQDNAYIRRAPDFYGWIILAAAALLAAFLPLFTKGNFLLLAIALSAGYCLLALSLLSQNRLWLPTFLPLALLCLLALWRLLLPVPVNKSAI